MPVVECQHCGQRCRTEDGRRGNHNADCPVYTSGADPVAAPLEATRVTFDIDTSAALESMRRAMAAMSDHYANEYTGVVIDNLTHLQDSIMVEMSGGGGSGGSGRNDRHVQSNCAHADWDAMRAHCRTCGISGEGRERTTCTHCGSDDLRGSYGRGLVCDGCNRIQPQRCAEHDYVLAGNPCPECERAAWINRRYGSETENGESASPVREVGQLCQVRRMGIDGVPVPGCDRLATGTYGGEARCRQHAFGPSQDQATPLPSTPIDSGRLGWTCPRCGREFTGNAQCELHMETCQQACSARGCNSDREWGTDLCGFHGTQRRLNAALSAPLDMYGMPIRSDASMARGTARVQAGPIPPDPAPERAHLEALQRAAGR